MNTKTVSLADNFLPPLTVTLFFINLIYFLVHTALEMSASAAGIEQQRR